MDIDPLARARLEALASVWREVHPGGNWYTWDVMRLLDAESQAGRLNGSEAVLLLMGVSRYATHQSETLDLPW